MGAGVRTRPRPTSVVHKLIFWGEAQSSCWELTTNLNKTNCFLAPKNKQEKNQVRCWAKLHPKKFVLLYFPPAFVPQNERPPKKKPIWLRDLPVPPTSFRRMVAVRTSRGWLSPGCLSSSSRPKVMEVWFWKMIFLFNGVIFRFQALIFNWCKSLRGNKNSPSSGNPVSHEICVDPNSHRAPGVGRGNNYLDVPLEVRIKGLSPIYKPFISMINHWSDHHWS